MMMIILILISTLLLVAAVDMQYVIPWWRLKETLPLFILIMGLILYLMI